MTYLDQLLINELHTALAGHLKHLDLRLHKEIKGKFGDEKAGSRTGRVANGCSDVED